MKEIFVFVFGKPFGIVILQLLEATQFTIYLSLFAFFGGGVVGIVIALLRIYPSQKSKTGAVAYIWLFQSVPLLMLLFLFGLGIPRLFGQNVDPWIAAIGALTLYTSAYLADVWRGSIEAVPKGQWEGAFALNFTPAKRMRKIIIPQIFPIILPPAANLTVELLKATALVALVTVVDLTFEAKQINSITWLSAQCFGTALLIYYIISRFFLVPFLRWLEVLAARKVGKDKA